MVFTNTVEASMVQAMPAPFPNTKGTVTIQVLNSDQSLGPAVIVLRMEPGSEIARHLHEQTTETSYVLEGVFINEGISYHQARSGISSRTLLTVPTRRRVAAPSWLRSAIRPRSK